MPKETLENITITKADGTSVPVRVYVEEQERNLILEQADREVHEKSAGIHTPIITKPTGNISGTRSQNRRSVDTSAISEEVKQHINFLAKYKGEKYVSQYITENGTQNGELEKVIMGMQEKLSLITQEEQKLTLQRVQLEAAIQAIENAQQIMQGKVSSSFRAFGSTKTKAKDKTSTPKEGQNVGWGHWPAVIKELMLEHGDVTRKQLTTFLQEKGCRPPNIYNIITKEVKKGRLELKDGRFHWTAEVAA